MTFSEKIKRILQTEDINLKEFSELSGVSYGVIKSYSSGRREPTTAQIHRMTEHPRLAPYKNMLLSNDETTILEGEFAVLFRKLEKAGKGEQALEYLRYLAEREGQ